jgi:hypothetical protein
MDASDLIATVANRPILHSSSSGVAIDLATPYESVKALYRTTVEESSISDTMTSQNMGHSHVSVFIRSEQPLSTPRSKPIEERKPRIAMRPFSGTIKSLILR